MILYILLNSSITSAFERIATHIQRAITRGTAHIAHNAHLYCIFHVCHYTGGMNKLIHIRINLHALNKTHQVISFASSTKINRDINLMNLNSMQYPMKNI